MSPAHDSKPARVTLLERDGIDDALRAEWRNLGEAADAPNPYFLPWFLGPALTHLEKDRRVKLCLVRAADGTLIGLAPVSADRGYAKLPLTYLSVWRHQHCFNGAPLIREGAAADVYGALIDWIDTRPEGAGLLRLTMLPMEAETRRTLTQICAKRGRSFHVQHAHQRAILMPGGATSPDYDTHMSRVYSGKKRKELRRQAKRFGELGRAEFTELPVNDATLDAFIALENAGWKKAHAEGFPMARSAGEEAFFRAAMKQGAAAGAVSCLALTLEGAPAAMLFTLFAGARAAAFKTSYDETRAAYSPGVRLLMEATRRTLATTQTEQLDSCARPGHPVADTLWSDRLEIAQINIAGAGFADRLLYKAASSLERLKSALHRTP